MSKIDEINSFRHVLSNQKSINYYLNQHAFWGRKSEFIYHRNLDFISNQIKNNKKILMICCGPGYELQYFTGKGGNVLIGLDISFEMCKISLIRKNKYKLEFEVITGDAEKLPFRDKEFEIGICYQGLHHLPNPLIGLQELCRCSKDIVCFVEPIDCLARNIFQRFGFFTTEYSGFKTYNFTKNEIQKNLRKNGFNIKIYRYFDYLPKIFYKLQSNNYFMLFYKFMSSNKNKLFGIVGNQCLVIAKSQNKY